MVEDRSRSPGLLYAGDWRAPVLNACLWIAAILSTIWIAFIVAAFPLIRGSVELFAILPCIAAAWIGVAGRRLSEWTRVSLLLFFCLGVAAVSLEAAGVRPAPVVMLTLFVLLATLYLDWRAGVAAGGMVMLVYAIAAWGWVTGRFPHGKTFNGVDYTDVRPWVMGATVQLFGVGAVGTIVAYVLAHAARALRQANESEEKFSTAFRASPDSIIITDAETGRIIDINGNFERMFGFAHDEAVGRTSLELGMWIDPGDRKRFTAAIARDGAASSYAGSARRKDGSIISFETSAEVIELAGRRCLLGIVHDIAERLRHEREREALEAQVRESQKLEALGTLAGGVAHDFNNLLMVMMSNAELARADSANPAEVQVHVNQILAAGARARDLVRQILAFSRKEVGERRPIHGDRVIVEAVRLLRSTLPTTIEIRADIDPLCASIMGDSSQLHQIMLNLGTNAAHAMRDRPGMLLVALHNVDIDAAFTAHHPELKPGPHVRLTVADTGHGMPPPIRDRIFEPFFTTKQPGEGTGLGLAVVHGIVRAHEGAITVESGEGKGTTFDVYFPAYTATPVEPEHHGTAEHVGRGEAILLIDDEPAIGRTLGTILERLGYVVDAFSDADGAVARLRAEPQRYGLILTDLTMPRLTGIDVAHAAQTVRPDLPVLLMTGYSATWTREKVRAAGLHDLISKPINRVDLAAAVRSALDHRSCESRQHSP